MDAATLQYLDPHTRAHVSEECTRFSDTMSNLMDDVDGAIEEYHRHVESIHRILQQSPKREVQRPLSN